MSNQSVQVQVEEVKGQTFITTTMLACASRKKRKEMLNDRLFYLLKQMYSQDMAKLITDKLIRFTNESLLRLLDSNELLRIKASV